MTLLRTRTARHVSLVATVNVSSAVLRFFVTVLMAGILSPVEWGNIAVFIAMMDIVSVLSDSGLNATLVRFVAADAASRTMTIFSRCVTVKVAMTVLLLGVLWLFHEPILENQQFPDTFHWVYPLAVSSGIFLSFFGLFLSVFQARQEYGRYSLSYLSVNTFRAVGLGVLLVVGVASLRAVTVSFFCAPAVALVLTFPLVVLTLKRTIGLPRPAAGWKTMLLFMAPLSVMGAITIGNMRISNFMLKTLASSEAVGNYELAYQIGAIFPLLTGALITVLLPKVSAMQSQEELRNYRKRLLRMYWLLLPLTLAGMVIGPWFIAVVFGAKYAPAGPIIRVLIVGLSMHIVTQPLSLIFYVVSRPAYLAAIYLVQFLLTLVLNYCLIPKWGGMGAALALLTATLFAAVSITAISGWVIRGFKVKLYEKEL